MCQDTFLRYLELALKNLTATKAMRFNVESEVIRLMKTHSEEEIHQKVKEIAFKPNSNQSF